MEETRARRVVESLRALGVAAHLERPGVYAFGVAVQLPDGRRAVWGADSELSATVLRDGVLVGFLPALPQGIGEPELVQAIARADYDSSPGQQPAPARRTEAPRRGLLGRVRKPV